jgi:hypothetical protein
MIWIELLSRHREVTARYPSPTDKLTIGRGYDNALIIDDPCVAPRHLRIFRDAEGCLMAEDMGTQNGICDEAGKRHIALRLDGNTLMRVGQTWLRVREADFAVSAEQTCRQKRSLWPWLLALLAITPLLLALSVWVQESEESALSDYLGSVFPIMIMLGVWVGLWVLSSRLLSGVARLAQHTLIALVAVICLTFLEFFQNWVIFAFSSPVVARYGFASVWLLLAVTCLCHLYLISAKRLSQKALIVFSLAAGAILAQWLMEDPFKAENILTRSVYLKTLFPPSWRMVTPKSETDFFEDIRKMEVHLDELRKEEFAEEEADAEVPL